MMGGVLEIHTFGGLSICVSGEAVIKLASRKVEALLVYLACSGRAQPREALAELLWEERSLDRALGNLRVALTSLRKHLGEFLHITRETISLDPEANVWLDTLEMENKLAAGQVEEALLLYQGDFMAGFYLRGASGFEEWTSSERQRWHQTAINALHDLIDALLASGRFEDGLAHTQRLLRLDPLDEAAHRKMMTLLAYTNKRSAALEQYQACLQILEDELGVGPAQETTRLYEKIQAGELQALAPTAAPQPVVEIAPEPPPFLYQEIETKSVRPLFVAREREVERLEDFLDKSLGGDGCVTFVSGGPGLGKTALLDEFAHRSMDNHPTLLVAVGTCNQYSGIGDPYLPWREILSTLSGDVQARWTAGTVSTEHARRLWKALPNLAGALLERGPHLFETFISGKPLLKRLIAAAPERGDLLASLRQRVVHLSSGTEGMEQSHLFEQFTNVLRCLAETYPLLLILDDLQWADTSSISLLFHLSRRLGGARILIAGAYRPEEVALGRQGERHPLEKALVEFKRVYGDVWVDLTQSEESEGHTFVHALLDSEPNLLDSFFREALYRHTGGHPLFTIELLRAMQERGDLLLDEERCWVAGPTLDWERLPPRVEAVIEERIAHLEAELREILTVASVEGEDFTAQVVARVQEVGERELLRLLSMELEKRHRLVCEGGEVFVGLRVLSRYRFTHTLFQRYLYNELSEGERRLLHRQIACILEELYAGQIEEIAAQLAYHYTGDPERERHYARLAGERASARFANTEALRYFDRALELTLAEDLAGRYELLLRREEILNMIGERQAQERNLASMKELAEALDDDRLRLGVALLQALHAERTTDFQAEALHAQRAIQLAEATQDLRGQAAAYLRWGRALFFQGDNEKAEERMERALELARISGAKKVEASVLRIIGTITEDPLDPQYIKQALGIYRQIGDKAGESIALLNLGALASFHGDHSMGKYYYQQALTISQEIGDRDLDRWLFGLLAHLSIDTGDYSRAEDYAEQALEIAHQIGARIGECVYQRTIGGLSALLGDYLRAKEYTEVALRMACELGLRDKEGYTLCGLSFISHHLGEIHVAMVHAQLALHLAQEVGSSDLKAAAWESLGRAYEGFRDLEEAKGAYLLALDIRRKWNQPHLVAENLAGLARLSQAGGALPQAQAYVEQVLETIDSKKQAAEPKPGEDQGTYHPLDGTVDPVRIYLTCYQVLEEVRDPRAEGVLIEAYDLLRARAANIEDDDQRHSFLKNVPAHAELLRLWASRDEE